MFTITIVAVGKLKEPFYRDACAEYAKRLPAYCRLDMIELAEHRLPDDPSPAQIAAGLAKEASAIRARSAGRAAAGGQDRRGVVGLLYPGQLLRAGPGG